MAGRKSHAPTLFPCHSCHEQGDQPFHLQLMFNIEYTVLHSEWNWTKISFEDNRITSERNWTFIHAIPTTSKGIEVLIYNLCSILNILCYSAFLTLKISLLTSWIYIKMWNWMMISFEDSNITVGEGIGPLSMPLVSRSKGIHALICH